MKEIDIKEYKTINELLDELRLSSASFLIRVNRQILHPNEIKNRRLKKGDKVSLIPLADGG